MIASAATAGLIALMPEINFFLFGDRQGNTMLSVYVLSIVFATLIMIYNSILQSLNEFRVTLIGLAIGLLVKLVITERSVVFMGAAGASWATVIALAVMTYMLTRQVQSLHLNVFQDRLISNS
ncbi:polysaccharide biosynthesis C-terminal domain-containing protein [Secundilactobacillus paracollinoides]|uniref:polysaccharide biosynthesis C-terminal domain-containing protein n=1 Tax=Secundilactobacillus paracollinoides TaxID=240427 RepID=UPI000AA631D6|nr:polysaccharide biosynthesis C-terminal domain-containing protein [Secundilactobacillus paracollinoides]